MDIAKYTQRLEEMRTALLRDLGHLGVRDKAVPGDWLPKREELNTDPADDMEVAERVGAFEERVVEEEEVEEELRDVEAALLRITKGTYGICRVCKTKIEDARLAASPHADTCIAHKEA